LGFLFFDNILKLYTVYDRKSFCKLQYQISNIVNSRYRGVDWLAVAGNRCLVFALCADAGVFPPDNPNGKGGLVAKQAL
jgi:hypothetical protein